MTKERMGEIALECLKLQIREDRLPFVKPEQIRRRVGEVAKKLDISFEECQEFHEKLNDDMLAELQTIHMQAFARKQR